MKIMKTKLFKNIFFITLFLLIMLSVAVFNYGMDPYNVFKNKKYMYLDLVPRNYINIELKAYKNIPFNTVVIGSSNTGTLFHNTEYFSHYFNKISIAAFSYEQQYNLLKYYLNLHPETKKVYIFVNYPAFIYSNFGTEISKLSGNKFNIKELFFLLLSKDTSLKSLENAKQKKPFQLKSNKINYNIDENPPSNFDYHPYSVTNFNVDNRTLKNLKEENFKYLKEMTELLKSKNTDYTFVIPPHHAVFQAAAEDIPFLRNSIDDCLKMLVKISDNDVYNFSIINKYTDYDLKNNYLYIDFIHLNYIMGIKIFKALYYNLPEKNLYVKLNKNNIEKEIQKNHRDIAKYIRNNKATVEKIKNYHKNHENPDFSYKQIKTFDNAPVEITKEMDFYREKAKEINECYNQGNCNQMDLWGKI